LKTKKRKLAFYLEPSLADDKLSSPLVLAASVEAILDELARSISPGRCKITAFSPSAFRFSQFH
jgi:hypothetical protein